MTEPIDIRKYEFISMPVREQWGVWVQEDHILAAKEFVTTEDLVGQSLISPAGDIAESNLGRWFGNRLSGVSIIAKGNLLYNEAILAQRDIGMILGIRLNCNYERLRFIPFSPALETTTTLAWKKEQVFSTAAATFIDFAKKYIEGITGDYK